MLCNTVKIVGSASVLMPLLAGCGTTGNTTAANTLYAEDAGLVKQAYESGLTLHTDTSVNSSASAYWACGDVTCSEPGASTVSIAANDQGGIDVTVDGEMTSFSQDDLQNPGVYTIVSAEGDVVGAANYASLFDIGGDYHEGWHVWQYDAEGARAYTSAVLGTETTPDVLAGKSNATYSGSAATMVFFTALEGDIAMNADFDAAAISGTMTNLHHTNGNEAGSIIMETAAIDGNGFSGNVSASADFTLMDGVSGTYTGKFYGPDAEEVGGAIGMSGHYDGCNCVVDGVGVFSGAEQ